MEGKKLKILMTADTLGGVWTYTMDLCRGLRYYPVQIHLATFGSYLNKFQRDQVKLVENIKVYESGYKLEWMDNPWEQLDKAFLWIQDIHDFIKPDIIHFNNYGQAHREWKTPNLVVSHSCVVSWWRAVKMEEAPPEWNRYRNIVAQALMKADLVVAPTFSFLKELEEIYGSFVHKRAIHNGRHLPDVISRTKEPFILAAGRVWDEAKNLLVLAEVANHLDWPVYIAGENEHPVTKAILQAKNVHYLGNLAPNDLLEWMQRASIYALPAHYEPFGLSILEAASSGCALLLGDIGSLRELWSGAAVFVDQKNPKAVAAALENLIRNEGLRENYASLARERSLHYSLKNMAKAYFDIYKMLSPANWVSKKAKLGSSI